MLDHALDLPDRTRDETLRAVFARRGFHPESTPEACREVVGFGASALGGGLVAPEVLLACERRTGRCLSVRRDGEGVMEGFIALLHLSEAGALALFRGRFRPGAPAMDHLTTRGEAAAALYVWCLAANGTGPKRALVRAVTEARRKAFPDIPLFARPMSREGRLMTAALDAPSAGQAWLGWIPAAPDA